MKKNLFATLCVFTILFLVSCQKEASFETNRQNEVEDGSLISRIILLDTTLPAPYDSSECILFLYDQQKRVTSIIKTFNNGIGFDTISKSKLFYVSNDTLPYKGITTFPDLTDQQFTLFKKYDGFGRTVSDSLIDKSGTDSSVTASRYTYMANLVKVDYHQTLYYPGQVLYGSNSYYIEQHRSGNNIIFQTDSTDLTPYGGSLYVRVHNFQYDNHPNPFKKYWHFFPYYQYSQDLRDNFCNNNFTEIHSENKDIQNSLTEVHHLRYAYEYNSKGWPKVSRETNVTDGTVIKYVYLYAE